VRPFAWEGEAPAEPDFRYTFRLGGGLAFPSDVKASQRTGVDLAPAARSLLTHESGMICAQVKVSTPRSRISGLALRGNGI
jgi:hypothetical protein